MKPAVFQGLLQLVASLLLLAAALLVYDRHVVRPAQRIGVVDVAEVYRQKEAEFSRLLGHSPAEADRQNALRMARAFAQRLPAALEELPRDCACLVVLKSAVAGPAPRTIDLTGLLHQKVETP